MKTATERLLGKASFENGYLIWHGAIGDGYGLIWYKGKLVRRVETDEAEERKEY